MLNALDEYEDEDLNNYKGEHYDSQREKYQDPITGAHFRYKEVYNKLSAIQRKQTEAPFTFENNPQILKLNCGKKVKSWNVYRYLFKSQDSVANAIDKLSPASALKPKPLNLKSLLQSKDKAGICSSNKPGTSQSKYECKKVKPAKIRASLMYIMQSIVAIKVPQINRSLCRRWDGIRLQGWGQARWRCRQGIILGRRVECCRNCAISSRRMLLVQEMRMLIQQSKSLPKIQSCC
eukprot:TRINITY_DN6462_c0_g1_i1.p2 TRINITY_DN6462_c0_g1~~TRINITY_DN6462_c0_g1_i1.p2  ORF type:complete len:235 (+),score=26.30 TRINITY_DN6462_c0_g1_i1:100-804(+)